MEKVECPVPGSMDPEQVPSGSNIVQSQVPSGNNTAQNQVPSGSIIRDQVLSGSTFLDQFSSGSMVSDQAPSGSMVLDQIASGCMTQEEVPSGSISLEQAAMQRAPAQSRPSGSHITALTTSMNHTPTDSGPLESEPASKRSRRSISPLSPADRQEVSSPSELTVDTTKECEAWGSTVDGRWGRGDKHVSDISYVNPSVENRSVEKLSLEDYATEVPDYHEKVQQLPRRWELTEMGARYKADDDLEVAQGNSRHPVTFTLMSYNILAQDLIDMNLDLYTASSPESLDWEHRRCQLMAEIAYHGADILSLQEVQEDHFLTYLEPRLEKLGYTGRYQKRTGDKTDGCATLWKRDKFRLLSSVPVIYCRGGLLDRDNIALIVQLQPVRTEQGSQEVAHDPEDKILVANTHLLFNPRRGDIKLAQLMILFAEIDKHAYLGPSQDEPQTLPSPSWDSMGTERYCPVIMSGDFNMEPYSALYKFIISGSIKYEGLAAKELSGQQEGWRGASYYLQRHFLSPMYGVTDLCQYHSVAVERLRLSYQLFSRASVQSSVGQDKGGKASQGNGDQCGSQTVEQSLQTKNSNSLNKGGEQSYRLDSAAEGKATTDVRLTVDPSDEGKKKTTADSPGEGKKEKTIDPSGYGKKEKTIAASNDQEKEKMIDLAGERKKEKISDPPGDRKRERSSDRRPISRRPESDLPPLMPSKSGCMSHRFNLFSAYRHKVQRLGEAEEEVTTHHSRAECTVDFIFYLPIDFYIDHTTHPLYLYFYIQLTETPLVLPSWVQHAFQVLEA